MNSVANQKKKAEQLERELKKVEEELNILVKKYGAFKINKPSILSEELEESPIKEKPEDDLPEGEE